MFSYHPPFTPPTTEDDRLSWLRLIRSRRVGPATFHRLIAEHGSARAALLALPRIAQAAGLTDYAPCPEGVAQAELRAGAKLGAQLLCHGAPGYPANLAAIADAPPILWARGDTGLLQRPMVALIGARNASSLGLRMARKLGTGLTDAGFVVVSGLARGIDAAAHAAALPGGTIAVLAGGLDRIYPAENTELAHGIAEDGLILSEQPFGLEAQARHFPQRNRIVAGLSRGVVVVEAAAQSGSLITARMALDMGREVCAVPGHPFDARASGCNMLIRDGATLVRGPEDVVAAIAQDLRGVPTEPAGAPAQFHGEVGHRLSGAGRKPATGAAIRAPGADASTAGERDRQPVADVVRTPPPAPGANSGTGPALPDLILRHLGPSPLAEDQLIRDLAIAAGDLAPALLMLELEGRVRRHPGGLLSTAV